MVTRFYTYENCLKYSYYARMMRVTQLARFLDARWKFPGTDFKFGIEGLLGIIPFIGDSISSLLALYILYEAHQMQLPWHLKVRIAWNIFFDWMIGWIPLIGDILDFANKSNLKNIEIIKKHFDKHLYPV